MQVRLFLCVLLGMLSTFPIPPSPQLFVLYIFPFCEDVNALPGEQIDRPLIALCFRHLPDHHFEFEDLYLQERLVEHADQRVLA